MMFNKILVLTDAATPITDYATLARTVMANCNVATDVAFATGPMDVLDHACNALGFGGKMCIDGTAKLPEETDTRYAWPAPQRASWIASAFPDVTAVNDALFALDIPVLFVAVHKNRPHHVEDLHARLCADTRAQGIKMILYVEHTVPVDDLAVALWRVCNNLDPKRDHYLVDRKPFACLGLDGTLKTRAFDGFQRDWPNIIVADDKTIAAVDKKWPDLGIGDLIPSPSLKFKAQMYGPEAVANPQ